MSFVDKCKSFWSWEIEEKILFLKAFLWLIWSSLALKYWSFKKLKNRFGNKLFETSTKGLPEERKVIIKISKALDRAIRIAFWNPNCYPQAITAKILLKNHCIPSTLYLGVKKEKNELKAHAWTRSQDLILTGGKNASEYKILSFFS